jgi:hypothetical protein
MNTYRPSELEADLMTQSRDPFGLSALPGLQPPTEGWNAIATALQQQRSRRSHWISGLAVAASVTLALGLVVGLPPPSEPVLPAGSVAQQEQPRTDTQSQLEQEALPEVAAAAPTPENLLTLQKLSQRLEQNLAYLRSGVGSMPAEMVVYQVELEDLVAQVDAAISQQPDSSQLWQQRVNLLLDLNQIYGEGLRRDDPYVASL